MARRPPSTPPRADAHTRLVALAKVALPLLGLGLLSSLFLLAGSGERPSPPLAPEARGIAQKQRLSAPVHAGVTARGDAIEIAARLARPNPDDPHQLEAEELRARVVTARGSVLDLEAPSGRIDTARGIATLSGGLRLTGAGLGLGLGEGGEAIEAETEGVAVDLSDGRAESDGPVRAEAPFGAIEAGAMVVEGERIEFADGVRLVHTPPPAEE